VVRTLAILGKVVENESVAQFFGLIEDEKGTKGHQLLLPAQKTR
jgi:hypothetical protein